MLKLTAPVWLFAFGLVTALPTAAMAQNDTGQPTGQEDNTAYGTTAAEFLLLGAGARGTALGGSFAAIATDISALYYNPAGAALIEKAGLTIGTYDYVADTRYSWGGVAFPISGGSRTIGFQLGTFGFSDQPVYTEEQPDGTGATYSVDQTFVGAHLRPELLRPLLRRHHRQVRQRPAGHGERQRLRGGLRHQFPRDAQQSPGQVLLRAGQPGVEPDLRGHRPRAATCRGTRSRAKTRPRPCRSKRSSTTKDFPLPTTFRVGLAYDLITGDNNRLTVLGDFNQPNNNSPGFAFGSEWNTNRIGDSNFGFALRGSYSYTGANDLEPGQHRDGAERRGESAGPRLRWRSPVRDGERRFQPRPGLRVQVSWYPRCDQLLQLHAGLVGGQVHGPRSPRPLSSGSVAI